IHTVFQHYALFPHYNVFENIAFGLRIRKLPELEIVRRVAEALALVKLSGFESRRTTQLSGGQMQRVALARALVGRPAVLLLDEPLGALDFKLRKEMQLELKTIQRELHMTFVYVTHDQEEAMTLSDRIAVFHAGRIEQIGVPEEIYERPKTSFVADFIGAANVLSARLLSASEGRVRVRIEDELELELPYAGQVPVPVGEPINVAIRPERIAIRYRVDNAEIDGSVRLKGSLVENVYVGNASQIFFQPFAKNTRALLSVSLEPQHRAKRQIGSPLWADIRPRDFLLLEPSPNGNQSQ
ncbi:MAG: ATP-binding cassette domain-containing protein, partial [Elusimicrobia bacterium]|nr:ATP-binding cassette domain-containing protein [Elusimicrobiota bacterium]